MSLNTFGQRISFASTKNQLEYPDFLEIQLKAFSDFFQLETTPEKRKILLEHPKQSFDFDSALDAHHLSNLYGADFEHAEMMFETFLQESLLQWASISDALEYSDILQIREMAHRFIPSVSMVGLTDVERILIDLEKNISAY